MRPYLVINLVLAAVIILIFAYSAVFSPDSGNYPVACVHEAVLGEPCPSCGMSHAFSLILRGRIDEAREWNYYSVTLFLFFAVQLFFRLFFSVADRLSAARPIAGKVVLLSDIVISSVMVLVVFYPMMRLLYLSTFFS
jgi:hypothetical protein